MCGEFSMSFMLTCFPINIRGVYNYKLFGGAKQSFHIGMIYICLYIMRDNMLRIKNLLQSGYGF